MGMLEVTWLAVELRASMTQKMRKPDIGKENEGLYRNKQILDYDLLWIQSNNDSLLVHKIDSLRHFPVQQRVFTRPRAWRWNLCWESVERICPAVVLSSWAAELFSFLEVRRVHQQLSLTSGNTRFPLPFSNRWTVHHKIWPSIILGYRRLSDKSMFWFLKK
jgi:hypothetical protein